MSNDRLEPFNYHNIAFKRCADVVSLERLDRLWFFRHHWFVKIGWFGKCWTDLLAFWCVWNRSRILNFGPDRLFFQFSRALSVCLHACVHMCVNRYQIKFSFPLIISLHITFESCDMRVLQKVLSLGSDYFNAIYQTYFYYKPSKYSRFTETHFCNLFTQSRKADSLLLVSVGDTDK